MMNNFKKKLNAKKLNYLKLDKPIRLKCKRKFEHSKK